MQFKALKAAENTAKIEAQKKKTQVDVTEMFSAPKNVSHEKTPADTLREEMNLHSSEAEKAQFKPAKPAEPVKPVEPVKPKKSSTPDINDIIKKSENNAKKKNVSNMSVDDLLKLIEDEKNKL